MSTFANNRNDDPAEAAAKADAAADEILIAFAEAGPEANLSEWTRRYPDQARSLVRLAAARRWSANPSPDKEAADAHVLAIGRRVLEAARAKAQQPAPVAAPASAAPLTNLLAAARARGLSPEAVADRLDLPVACFWKLHRRLFAPDSLPRALIAQLAAVLDRTTDEIAACLRQSPTLAAGASYKADDAPAVGAQEDFARALAQDTELTESQRSRWLSPPAASAAVAAAESDEA